ncbi:KGK domain-containing protein [Nostoc sp.]
MSESIGLSSLDVVSIEKGKSPLNASTFKVSELIVNLANKMSREFSSEILNEWAWHGVPCEVLLRDGLGWQSGRVKFSLEFIPDPQEDEVTEDTEDGSEKLRELKALPESSLDDLRAELLDI